MQKKNKEKLDFLVDNGLLFEINRTVLHPFGLELVANSSGKLELLNYGQDSIGTIYDSDAFITGQSKLINFMELAGEEMRRKRIDHYGFIIQPYVRKK